MRYKVKPCKLCDNSEELVEGDFCRVCNRPSIEYRLMVEAEWAEQVGCY